MDKQEDFYEKLKAEVWEKMRSELLANETQYEPVSRKEVFNYAFDMGYKNGAAYAPKENIFHITQKLQSDDNLGKKHAREEVVTEDNQLRLQVATAAMHGILSNKILYEATLDAGEKHSVESKTAISRVALSFADALLGR